MDNFQPDFEISFNFIKGVMFGFEIVTKEDSEDDRDYFVLDLFILRIMVIV
jgi:hypothetical protein